MTDNAPDSKLTEQEKRHIVMWTAVVGITVCVVGVWLVLLPLQLQKEKVAGLSGWFFRPASAVNAPRLDQTAGTFDQGLSDLHSQLQTDAIQPPAAASQAQLDKTAKIEALKQALIDAAAKKTDSPTNAPAVDANH